MRAAHQRTIINTIDKRVSVDATCVCAIATVFRDGTVDPTNLPKNCRLYVNSQHQVVAVCTVRPSGCFCPATIIAVDAHASIFTPLVDISVDKTCSVSGERMRFHSYTFTPARTRFAVQDAAELLLNGRAHLLNAVFRPCAVKHDGPCDEAGPDPDQPVPVLAPPRRRRRALPPRQRLRRRALANDRNARANRRVRGVRSVMTMSRGLELVATRYFAVGETVVRWETARIVDEQTAMSHEAGVTAMNGLAGTYIKVSDTQYHIVNDMSRLAFHMNSSDADVPANVRMERHINGRDLLFRAIRPIAPGESIRFSYAFK